MKSYFLMIIALYILAGSISYNVLISLSISSSMLIAVIFSVLAFFFHMYMEGIIVTDDYDPKLKFKDHLSDSKYCCVIGVLIFVPAVFVGTGLSLLMAKSLAAGSVLLFIGGFIGWAGWRYSNAS